MSALKFECPDCGQHMECERALSGDVIHCPRCCAELRIPFSEIGGAILRAQLLKHGAQAQPVQAATAPAAPASTQSTAMPNVHELVCPVCESQLRIRAAAPKHDGHLPLAELIKKGEPKAPVHSTEPAVESKAEESHPDLKHMTVEERERHIAAMREAHPIQLSAPVKPRLSYVLSGKSPAEEKQEKDRQPDPHPPFNE